jgi:hypothetical protein
VTARSRALGVELLDPLNEITGRSGVLVIGPERPSRVEDPVRDAMVNYGEGKACPGLAHLSTASVDAGFRWPADRGTQKRRRVSLELGKQSQPRRHIATTHSVVHSACFLSVVKYLPTTREDLTDSLLADAQALRCVLVGPAQCGEHQRCLLLLLEWPELLLQVEELVARCDRVARVFRGFGSAIKTWGQLHALDPVKPDRFATRDRTQPAEDGLSVGLVGE